MPRVSVVMSVYNGERYLREAIDCILNQTFSDFEFIIINDGSTDRTADILASYDDSRIKVMAQQNVGLTKSLNRGIRLARGEYIARQDADDISLPQRFEKQVAFLDEHPDIGMIGTACEEVDSRGELIDRTMFPVQDAELRKALIRYNPFFHASVMVRKTVLDETGAYDEKFRRTQDYDLWFRSATACKLGNLPDFLVKRRYDGGNVSYVQENAKKWFEVRAKFRAILRRQYAPWRLIHLIRPMIVILTPPFARRLFRKYLSKRKNVFRRMKKEDTA